MRNVTLLFQAAALAGLGALVVQVGPLIPDVDRGIEGSAVYPQSVCMTTPMRWIPSPCGCPVPGEPWDFCNAVLPPNGEETITGYVGCYFIGVHTCIDDYMGCGIIWACGGGAECDGEEVVPADCWDAQKNPPYCTSYYYWCHTNYWF